jgi:hypothetical protein
MYEDTSSWWRGSCGVPATKQAHEPYDPPYPESGLSVRRAKVSNLPRIS